MALAGAIAAIVCTSSRNSAANHSNDRPQLVRFAVLRFLSMWAFSIIGFGPLGPIAGKLLATSLPLPPWIVINSQSDTGTLVTAWQAGYGGLVPAGGLFAFLQSIAMQLA